MPAAVSTPAKLLPVNLKKLIKKGQRSLYFLVGRPAKYDRKGLFNSNKSATKCSSFPIYCPDVYLQLNMFQAFSCPSSGAQ
jgi:hypothetical protein